MHSSLERAAVQEDRSWFGPQCMLAFVERATLTAGRLLLWNCRCDRLEPSNGGCCSRSQNTPLKPLIQGLRVACFLSLPATVVVTAAGVDMTDCSQSPTGLQIQSDFSLQVIAGLRVGHASGTINESANLQTTKASRIVEPLQR